MSASGSGGTIELLGGIHPGPVVIDGDDVTGPLLIRSADGVVPGGVVIRGGGSCTRAVVTLRRARDVTLRGLTIEATGPGVDLPGSMGGSERVRIEQTRIQGDASCGSGVRVVRGRDVVLINDLISGFADDGIRLRSLVGPYRIVQTTVYANARNGIAVGRGGAVDVITSAVAGNGRRPGAATRDAGVRRSAGGRRRPGDIRLIGSVVCGNQGGEISSGVLDSSDVANRTPTGSEGAGVVAAGADCSRGLFVDAAGIDGRPGTADDDLRPALGSALLDGSIDPRSVPELVGLWASLEADLIAGARRPSDGDGDGTARFDAGAIERLATESPTPPPSATATPTMSPRGTPTPSPTEPSEAPTATQTAAPTNTPTSTAAPSATPTSSPTPTSTGGTPGPAPERELTDGGSLFGPAGFAIGAVPGTLPTPLGVVIVPTALPVLPLPGGATPYGDAFFLAGSRDVTSGLGTGFVIALPIPPGVAMQHLGLAVFLPGDPMDPRDPDSWNVFPALVDAVRREMLVLLPHVSVVGTVLVIIEHPGLDSPVNPPDGLPTASGASKISSGRPLAVDTRGAAGGGSQFARTTSAPGQPATCPYGVNGFDVVCMLADPVDQEICEDSQSHVRDLFQSIFAETVSLGFPQPAINTFATALQVSPPSAAVTCTYMIIIDRNGPGCASGEDGSGGIFAYYRPSMQKLNMCIPPFDVPLTDTFVRVARHEYFHAVQYAYPEICADLQAGTEEDWVIESSATLFGGSSAPGGTQMIRRDHSYLKRLMDRSVTSLQDTDEYQLQDFWAYLFRENGTDLDRFKQLFNNGSSLDDVIDWQGGELSFGQKYMEWARNQTMAEKGKDENGDSVPACRFRPGSVTQVKETVDTASEVPIAPLTTVVHRWQWDGSQALDVLRFWEAFSRFQGDTKIRFKAYRASEDCSMTEGGFRRFENVLPGEEFYLVVSNIDPRQERLYTIQFD